MSKIETKFALLPRLVDTWRPQGTKAIIWLQTYYIKTEKIPFKNEYSVDKYVLHLGLFSYEFWNG